MSGPGALQALKATESRTKTQGAASLPFNATSFLKSLPASAKTASGAVIVNDVAMKPNADFGVLPFALWSKISDETKRHIQDVVARDVGGFEVTVEGVTLSVMGPSGGSPTLFNQMKGAVESYVSSHPGWSVADAKASLKRQGFRDAEISGLQDISYPQSIALEATQKATAGADTFTDEVVRQGIIDYAGSHPTATEADIRGVAMSQYGVSKEQLDRVKARYFS